MIRLIITVIFLLVFFIISLPFFLILLLIKHFNKPACDTISFHVIKVAFKIVLLISGVKVICKGKENIPDDQAVLYVGNHNGFYDIITTYTLFKRPTGFVAKKEIKKVPILNIWMYFVNCLFLDRKDMRAAMKMILDGISKLKSGVSVCIFPEGTRSKDGKMSPFKEGSLSMGIKANVPIIPMAITGTAAVFESHIPFIKKSTVTVTFGEPVLPENFTKHELKHMGTYTHDIIEGMLSSY